jgi:hypothetical protein
MPAGEWNSAVRDVILNERQAHALIPRGVSDVHENSRNTSCHSAQDTAEAMTGGIAATTCSVLILATVWLAMHALPVSIG